MRDGLQRQLCYLPLRCVFGYKLLDTKVYYFSGKRLSPNFGGKECSSGYKQVSLAFENSLRSMVCLDLLGDSIQACQSLSQGRFFSIYYTSSCFLREETSILQKPEGMAFYSSFFQLRAILQGEMQ